MLVFARGNGLFVQKPSSQTSVVPILVSNLGLRVRHRPLVYVGLCDDRHSISHSPQPPSPMLACP
jgi:hypothetical protein